MICIIASITGVMAIAGISGAMLIAGMLLLFMLPTYLIMRKLSLDAREKIFLSFFVGFGAFPILVYYANKIIPSLKWSIAAVWLVGTGIGLLLGRKR